MYLLAQVCAEMTSPTNETVIVPGQSSDAVTRLIFGTGTWELQLTATAPGQEMLGGFRSLTKRS